MHAVISESKLPSPYGSDTILPTPLLPEQVMSIAMCMICMDSETKYPTLQCCGCGVFGNCMLIRQSDPAGEDNKRTRPAAIGSSYPRQGLAAEGRLEKLQTAACIRY